MGKKNFSAKKTASLTPIALVLLFTVVSLTLAFFFNSDFASQWVKMSGRVSIEAVGRGDAYNSIEDTGSSANLDIQLDRDYGVLIPNMPLTIYANCKVKRSTTKPLIRAKMTITIFDTNNNPYDEEGEHDWQSDLFSQLDNNITNNTNWYFHSDGYYYYLNSVENTGNENSILKEVDATSSDTIVNFLDKPITFPSYIEDDYSGLQVKIKIIFQAIQNYIPDDNGNKLPNTINNSLKIFDEFANNSYESSPISWFDITTTSDGKVTLAIRGGVTYPKNLRLPEKTADGKTITNLSSNLFGGSSTVEKVFIPSSYTSLEPFAFANSGIISVDASESKITSIPNNAFQNSKIVTIKLPNTCTTIGDKAFSDSEIQTITLPDSVTTAGIGCFWGCKRLISIYIPSSLINIGNRFYYGSALKFIQVDKNNPQLYDVDNKMLISKNGTMYMYANGCDSASITIPDEVTTLETNVFVYANNLKSIVFGKNLKELDSFALSSSITSVSIGSNTNFKEETDDNGNKYLLTSDGTQLKLTMLSSTATILAIPDSVVTATFTCMPESYRNNIEVIKFGSKYKYNSETFFNSTKLKQIIVDSSNINVKTLTGRELLTYDGKTFIKFASNSEGNEYSIPSGVTSLATRSFINVKYLKTLNLNTELKTINWSIFGSMSLITEINIPENVSYIGGSVLTNNSNLVSVTLNGSMYDSNVLIDNPKLKYVTINKCGGVGMNFLKNCSSLEWIEFKSTIPPTFNSSIMLQNTNNTFKIYVPDSAVNEYKTAHNFTSFASKIYPVSQKPSA